MCGIVGFNNNREMLYSDDHIELNRSVESKFDLEQSLINANAALVHRGPDDSGIYFNDIYGVGLGHRRLSILDPSPLGHQPMISDDGNIVLVFNGEIYNYKELRSELVSHGFNFKGFSDTEVLLNLYIFEGKDMLLRLNGIFSLAVWDCRTQIMLITRDAFGVKPLYYSESSNGTFSFASEIKALLHLVPDLNDIDAISLHRYLSYVWCPGSGTPLRGIKKLLPGEALEVQNGSILSRWKWFHLPFINRSLATNNIQDITSGLVSRLSIAVERQMVSDVPVGSFLSGGIDSSSIVYFAKKIDPDIRCFTINIKGSKDLDGYDDLPYAKKVAQFLKVPLDVIDISPSKMALDLERMVIMMDEPIADPAALNVLYISELAREQGIKVLLSGVGGDDLFTGYRRHSAASLEKFFSLTPQFLRNFIANQALKLDQHNMFSRRVTKVLSGINKNDNDRLVNYFGWAKEPDLYNLYTRDFKIMLGDEMAASPFLDFLNSMPTDSSALEKMLGLEQRFFLSDHNLIYTDKMSMAAGVEVRVPFLDKDLVNFAAQIPIGIKYRHNTGKWILKKAMEPYLPKEIIRRPKTGFGAPLRHWMKFELHEIMNDLLSVSSLKKRGYFDPVQVQALIIANEAGRVDASYTLFSLMCIEIWCRNFIDSDRYRK